MTNGHSFDIIISYLGERETLREIVPPTNCPACNSELEFVTDQLFCLNTLCSARSAKETGTVLLFAKEAGKLSKIRIKLNLIIFL